MTTQTQDLFPAEFLAPLPEAACSVNIRFCVKGYGEAQATGRGATAQEAASNLKATMEATRMALTVPLQAYRINPAHIAPRRCEHGYSPITGYHDGCSSQALWHVGTRLVCQAHADAMGASFPPPLPSREERAAALLARGTEKALAAQDYGRLDRLTKAFVLVVRGYVEDVVLDGKATGVWKVHSQAEPATTAYTVQGRTCDCQDAHRHAKEADWWCKHAIAACMARELDRQEREAL